MSITSLMVSLYIKHIVIHHLDGLFYPLLLEFWTCTKILHNKLSFKIVTRFIDGVSNPSETFSIEFP